MQLPIVMRVRGFLDALELGDGGDVDQQVGLDQPQIQHRTERLAAGEKLHDDVVAAAERNRGGKIGRARIIEPNRLHVALRPACAMAVKIRRGVIGESSNSAPNGRKASLTALAIAAGGAMAPPSPMPLTPNSV